MGNRLHSALRPRGQGSRFTIEENSHEDDSLPDEAPGGCNEDYDYVALFDYQPLSASEIYIGKGERLKKLEESGEWMRVQTSATQIGWIPKNYTALASSHEIQEWFFGSVDRENAEHYLYEATTGKGTFLVRPSGQQTQKFSLSLKDEDEHGNFDIKHFRIMTNEYGYCFIEESKVFYTLNELINAYKGCAYCLPTRLLYSCPKRRPVLREINRDTIGDVKIQRHCIQSKRKVGDGINGEVWYGQYKDKVDIAIKMLTQGTQSREAFLKEAKMLKNLRHDNILIFYGVCLAQEPILIIMEFMDLGNLQSLLRHEKYRSYLGLCHLLNCTHQVAKGMAFLEEQNVIHRNLAARNVLVKAGLHCKISNFGFAHDAGGSTLEETLTGVKAFLPKWMAPESLLYNKFTHKSDVYSFSILMYEIFTYGCIPYPNVRFEDLARKVTSGYRMTKPASYNIPDKIFKIMCSAWHNNPEDRPTFSTLAHLLEALEVTGDRKQYQFSSNMLGNP